MKYEPFTADVSMIEDEYLKKLILQIKIPECLTNRPLMVGDDEQCKALRQYEKYIQDTIDDYNYDETEWFYCSEDF
ncbi:MAG: hypothetical protein ACOC33_04080 [bacterium]